MSNFGSAVRRTLSMASAMTVSVLRPRKSIFSRPSLPTAFMSNCTVMSPSCRVSGTNSSSGRSVMMMPAACLPVLRTMPSSTRAWSMIFRATGFFSRLVAQLGGLVDGGLELDVELVGDHLGQAVGLGVGQVVHARDVADDHLGAEGAVGDDVGHAVVAVFLADVVDDLAAAAHAEVDVEVRRRHALGVQEALEEQLEAERVEVGDAEQVGHDAAGARAAAGADGGCCFLRAQSMKSQTTRK
jgi:hypothetical protein